MGVAGVVPCRSFASKARCLLRRLRTTVLPPIHRSPPARTRTWSVRAGTTTPPVLCLCWWMCRVECAVVVGGWWLVIDGEVM